MSAPAPSRKIRSLHGFWRDLVPIYSVTGLVWCSGGALVLMVSGMLLGIEHPWTLAFAILFAGNFSARPMRMSISVDESDAVERLLNAEGYVRSTGDGWWRPANRRWWWRLLDSPVHLSRSGAEVISDGSMLKSVKAFLARRARPVSAVA